MQSKTKDEIHEIYTTADMIAEHLREEDVGAWRRILRIVVACGVDFSLDALRETYIIESNGGLLIEDKSRRRTMGGVWFHLIKHSISDELRDQLFQFVPRKQARSQKPKKVIEPFPWTDRKRVLQAALKGPGKVRIVKVTLVGRPVHVIEEPQCVIMAMKDTPRTSSLPKGLPEMPKNTTTYGVYLSLKHWARVKDALQNPDDELIISGHLAFDREMAQVCIFATEATTKATKIALKAAESQTAG